MVRHLTSGLVVVQLRIYHLQNAVCTLETMMVQMICDFPIPLQHFVTYQMELSDIVTSFETLEIKSDSGSHHSGIDHDSNKKGER